MRCGFPPTSAQILLTSDLSDWIKYVGLGHWTCGGSNLYTLYNTICMFIISEVDINLVVISLTHLSHPRELLEIQPKKYPVS